MLRSRRNGSFHSLPNTSSWSSVSLVKHRDKFTFFFANFLIPILTLFLKMCSAFSTTEGSVKLAGTAGT
jgi:hypothetical protein